MLSPLSPFSYYAQQGRRPFNYPTAIFGTEQELLIASWELFRPASTRKVTRLREEFKRMEKSYFVDFCAKDFLAQLSRKDREKARKVLTSFDRHHITPLSGDGTNDPENIALSPHKLHEDVHLVIQDAELGPEAEACYVPIPRAPSGQQVWGFMPTVIIVLPQISFG